MQKVLFAAILLLGLVPASVAETYYAESFENGYPAGGASIDSRNPYRWEHGLESRIFKDWESCEAVQTILGARISTSD